MSSQETLTLGNSSSRRQLTSLDPFFVHDAAPALFTPDRLLAPDFIVFAAF